MSKAPAPEVVELSAGELEQLLAELRAALSPALYERVETLLRTLQWVMELLQQKNASLQRLRRIIFGDKTEKARNLLSAEAAADSPRAVRAKAKGHGRQAVEDYPGASRVQVGHPLHGVGQLCPKCLKGKLYRLKTPARIVRVVARPIFAATVFELERLRCALCGALFTAPAPPEAGPGKYDPSVGVMLSLLRYGAGLPMYRLGKWQHHFGVPLPAATQWELIVSVSPIPALVYEAMLDLAAQGEVLHNDDTHMRVQSLRQEIARTEDPDSRTGIFTTGIVAQVGSRRIALFFTGQKHAGENLNDLLRRRGAQLKEPLQMCDGLSRNEPKEFQTLLANCLLHGRRQFVDLVEHFPQECRRVIEGLRQVYRFDAQAKQEQLSAAARLAFHQEHSRPPMDALHTWMQEQLEQKKVEPNSGLGQAFNYMQKRWAQLTRFLSVPGAPLDNNVVERALKMAILHRKNSLSFKTLKGARIGDVHMSLIHTCQLNQVNPFDYLTALQQHTAHITKSPAQWLPWNYRQAIETAGSG